MKKLLILLSSVFILIGTAGVAAAAPYRYSDFINNNHWFSSSAYSYAHTIGDGNDGYTTGHAIQKVKIALDFSWDFLDSRYFYSWNEDLHYRLDSKNYKHFGEIGNSVYTFAVNTLYLTDGKLGVTSHLNNYQHAYLDGSRLYGIADSSGTSSAPAPVPEPASMLLLGTGMVGLAGVSRKKIFKKILDA